MRTEEEIALENERRALEFMLSEDSCNIRISRFSEELVTEEVFIRSVRKNPENLRYLHRMSNVLTEESIGRVVEEMRTDVRYFPHVVDVLTDDMLREFLLDERVDGVSFEVLFGEWVSRAMPGGEEVRQRVIRLAEKFPEAVKEILGELDENYSDAICDTEVCLAAVRNLAGCGKVSVLQCARDSRHLGAEMCDAIRKNNEDLLSLRHYNYDLIDVELLKDVIRKKPSYMQSVPRYFLIRHFSDHPLFYQPGLHNFDAHPFTERGVIVATLLLNRNSARRCHDWYVDLCRQAMLACEEVFDPELVVSVFESEGCLHLLSGRGLDYLREKNPELADTFNFM